MPKIAIILGSGLGSLSADIENKITIPYSEIPNFPVSTVAGHKGELIFGTLENVPIIAMNGRFHYYEGYNLQETTYPIRVFKLLGVETLILTNAAGGINESFQKEDLMIICSYLCVGILSIIIISYILINYFKKTNKILNEE